MDRVRLAIVGCGNISQLNAPGYLQHPRCDVVALCDTDPQRAERRAREWGIAPRVYADFKQVLDDRSVDAVELLTPTWMHADQIVAALAAGKHVSCQKPLAITLAEADRIADAVARARTTFRVTENFLYYPPILKAKELLDAGAIGEPSLVRIHTTRAVNITGGGMEHDPDAMVWRRDRGRNPGGPLYDDGVHKYATAFLWIGEIGDISAIVTHGAEFLAETPAAAMWRFKGRDCLGIIDYTASPEMTIRARYYKADEFFEIHGSRGIIWVTRCTGEMLDMPPVVLMRGTETVSYQVPADWRLGFDGAAADFVDSLLAGRQPAQDVHTAKHILSVPLAIYEASRVGRPVAPAPLAPARPARGARPPGWQQAHAKRYLESHGQDGHIWEGVTTLLLTTKGRRSGQPRTTPLIYGRAGERYLVVASRGGAPAHPDWYQNLVAEPVVRVQVMAERFSARARTATAAEKPALWKTMAAIWPPYEEYQQRTSREIPVVVLERI